MKFLDKLFNYDRWIAYSHFPGEDDIDLCANSFNIKLWLSILAIFAVFMVIKVNYINYQWQGVDKDMNLTDGTSVDVIEHKVPVGNGYYRIDKEYVKTGKEIYGYVNKDKEFIQRESLASKYFDTYTILVIIGLIILGIVLHKSYVVG